MPLTMRPTGLSCALAVLRLTTSFIEFGRFAAERRERRGLALSRTQDPTADLFSAAGRKNHPKPSDQNQHWTVDGAECRESSSRALHAHRPPDKASMKDLTQEPTQPDYNCASPRTRGDY